MYTLVSAPVLGFDLVRMDGGDRVAAILVRALACTPDDLAVLARHYQDGPQRHRAWFDLTRAESRALEMRRVVDRWDSFAGQDPISAASTLRMLQRSAIGNLDGLLSCIRHDVLDWTWRAAGEISVQPEPAARASAVVCDAAAGAYSTPLISAESRRRLAAGWVAASRVLPARSWEAGPETTAVDALLARLRRLSPGDVDRFRRADRLARVSGVAWTSAVHEASWAVHLAGRTRAAAVAQLSGVEALRAADFPVELAASGGWGIVSGCLQALVVRDLLPEALVGQLVRPLEDIVGQLP